MSAYHNQYYSTSVMFQMADALHAAGRRLRVAAKALQAWLETRRRAAIALDEFATMSDRALQDIGLSRADVLRVAWGGDRGGDPAEAIR
jgi:uncharacterized protein YjiS (DUF1127 family)